MDEFIYIGKFMIWAFLTACALPFLDYCMASPRRILGWWRMWLYERALRRANFILLEQLQKEKPTIIVTETIQGRDARARDMYFSKLEQHAMNYLFWEKPLGACMVCFSPYLSWIVFFCCGLQSGFGSWWSYSLPLWFSVFVAYIYKKFTHYT